MKLLFSKAFFLSLCFILISAAYAEMEFKTSQNFRLIYDKEIVSEDFAAKISESFEDVYRKYTAWGFDQPFFMKEKLLNVYLIPKKEMEAKGRTGAFYPFLRFIEIGVEQQSAELMHIIAHEVFHAFQIEYYDYFRRMDLTAKERSRWLTEATAQAMADEYLESLGKTPLYVGEAGSADYFPGFYQDTFIRNFKTVGLICDTLCFVLGLAISRDLGWHSYNSSIYFSYLMDYYGGPALIKQLIEEESRNLGESEADILYHTLGDRFRDSLQPFAIALISGSTGSVPFRFSLPTMQSSENRIPNLQRSGSDLLSRSMRDVALNMNSIYPILRHDTFLNPSTGEVVPLIVPFEPYGTSHFYIDLFRGHPPLEEDPLTIFFPKIDSTIQVSVVIIENNNGMTILEPKDNIIRISDVGETASKEFYLISTNYSPSKASMEFSIIQGEPLYVKSLEVIDNETIYKATWVDGVKRQLTKEKDDPILINFQDSRVRNLAGKRIVEKTFKIKVLLSGLTEKLQVKIKDRIYDFGSPKFVKGEGALYTYYVTATISEDDQFIPFVFSSSPRELDANPATKITPGVGGFGGLLVNYEKTLTDITPTGGEDEIHKILLASSISDLAVDITEKLGITEKIHHHDLGRYEFSGGLTAETLYLNQDSEDVTMKFSFNNSPGAISGVTIKEVLSHDFNRFFVVGDQVIKTVDSSDYSQEGRELTLHLRPSDLGRGLLYTLEISGSGIQNIDINQTSAESSSTGPTRQSVELPLIVNGPPLSLAGITFIRRSEVGGFISRLFKVERNVNTTYPDHLDVIRLYRQNRNNVGFECDFPTKPDPVTGDQFARDLATLQCEISGRESDEVFNKYKYGLLLCEFNQSALTAGTCGFVTYTSH